MKMGGGGEREKGRRKGKRERGRIREKVEQGKGEEKGEVDEKGKMRRGR